MAKFSGNGTHRRNGTGSGRLPINPKQTRISYMATPHKARLTALCGVAIGKIDNKRYDFPVYSNTYNYAII